MSLYYSKLTKASWEEIIIFYGLNKKNGI
jgi:hypothetical protein